MNNETLNVYRPKLRNAFWAAGFLLLSVPALIILVYSVSLPEGTLPEKIIKIVVFILSWAIFAMSVVSAANCFRNIFSAPSVVLTNEKLSVERKGEIAINDLDFDKTEVGDKAVTFFGKNGETITVKSRMISIPVGTLAFAVKQRVTLLNKEE